MMDRSTTFRFLSADGEHQIFARQWLPDCENPCGIVQIAHGISEYIDRYAPVARFLASHGFIVVGCDHLGHGRTALSRDEYGFFAEQRGWSIVTADIRRLRVIMGEQYPDLPYFLLGHSMGSFLARTYLIDFPGTLTGCILSGTGQEPAPIVAAGRLVADAVCKTSGPRTHSKLIEQLAFGAYNKQFAPQRTRADWISRDNNIVDAYVADPLCSFMPTAGMFRDMMEGLQYIAKKSNLAQMDPSTPIYFFSGDKDPVGQNGKTVETVVGFFRQAGCYDVTLLLYPDGRHEMMNELNRDEVFADLLAWINSKLP